MMTIEQSSPGIESHNQNRIVLKKAKINSVDNSEEIRITNIKITDPPNQVKDKICILQSNVSSKAITQIINHKEVWNYFLSVFLSNEKNETDEGEKHDGKNKKCCLFLILTKLFPKKTINKEIESEIDFITFLFRTKYDNQNTMHQKLLLSIFRLFFGEEKNEELLQNFFFVNAKKQDNLFIFSLIQLLSLCQIYPSFTHTLYKITHTLVFYLFLKISSICFSRYNNEKMILQYNKNNSVTETLNDFYMGLLYIFVSNYENKINVLLKQEGIDHVIKLIEEIADKENPSFVLWKVKIAKEKYQRVTNSMSIISDESE